MCQRIGLIRDSEASRGYTGCSLTRKTLRRSRISLRVDQWSETTTHQRWQTDKNAARRTTYRSLSLVYRQALQAQLHLHLRHQCHRKQQVLHSIPHQQEVRVRVAQYGDASHETAETKNTNKNGDNETVRRNPMRDLPEWLEELTENLVDESVPAHRDAPAPRRTFW